jgi:hypothetical protein
MEPDYWQMDLNQVAAKITPRTKAIVPVHIYGHPTDMDPLLELAHRHGIMVIEDAAEAHGAEYKGRRAGGLGDAAGFSFYGNKIITTGEGGMVTTNNREIAKLAWNLRDHAFSHERHFWHKFVGFNYRMTNLQAAVGLAQVEQLDGFVAARRRQQCAGVQLPAARSPASARRRKPLGQECLLDVRHSGRRAGLWHEPRPTAQGAGRRGIETRTFLHPDALPAGLLATVQG